MPLLLAGKKIIRWIDGYFCLLPVFFISKFCLQIIVFFVNILAEQKNGTVSFFVNLPKTTAGFWAESG
jgi:hypothetical protein